MVEGIKTDTKVKVQGQSSGEHMVLKQDRMTRDTIITS